MQKEGISRYTSVAINQAVIEQTFLDLVSQKGRFHVERDMLPESLSLIESHPEDEDCYPINIKVRHLHSPSPLRAPNGTGQDTRSHLQMKEDKDSDAAKGLETGNAEAIESINAKYLLACDGAHSWTRRQLGLVMEGEHGGWGDWGMWRRWEGGWRGFWLRGSSIWFSKGGIVKFAWRDAGERRRNSWKFRMF